MIAEKVRKPISTVCFMPFEIITFYLILGSATSSAPIGIPGRFDFSASLAASSLSPRDSSPHQTTPLGDIFNTERKFGSFPSAVVNAFPLSQSPLGSNSVFGPAASSSHPPGLPALNQSGMSADAGSSEFTRLREELWMNRKRLARWEERVVQARQACEAWKREAEDAKVREGFAVKQLDEVSLLS